ncbi:MAG: NADH-quinone oxidoreductase subunit N [Deltaproteobacteria bacterium]|nr:NADH-quinone oxidoreductase subunit N [Deltaproteobacteria bacterium]
MNFKVEELLAIAPLILMVVMGCAILVAETFIKGRSRAGLAWLGVAGSLGTVALIVNQWALAAQPQSIFQGMLVVDRMSLLFDATFVISGIITILVSHDYMQEHGFEFGEFYPLVLFTVSGMMMVSHATHLLSLLIGIETMSIGAYVLTGCWRGNPRSTEGALKYYLMGAFATGFMVYGMALIYGSTGGALTYEGISAKIGAVGSEPIFLVGFYFILGALIFKVAAVPFHMWAPDAYEGAPSNVTGFMAAGVKAAAFAGLLRLMQSAFGGTQLAVDGSGWVEILSIVAMLTMILGNLAALRQENVKRMLAYSSVAHAGYVLVGFCALGLGLSGADSSVTFYLIAYTFTTLGSFAVVAWVGRRNDERLTVDSWAGLASERPGVALAMTIFLLSLGGVPPTAGFFGKFYLFRIAMGSDKLYPLVIVGVLSSVVSVYYYLRIVVAMYFQEPIGQRQAYASPASRVALLVAAFAVVALGVLPGTVIDWASGGGKAVVDAVAALAR